MCHTPASDPEFSPKSSELGISEIGRVELLIGQDIGD